MSWTVTFLVVLNKDLFKKGFVQVVNTRSNLLGKGNVLLCKKLLKFIYFWERHRQHEQGGSRERGREGERISSRLCTASKEPNVGLELTKLWDHDLSRNQESDAQPTELPRHPRVTYKLSIVLWVQVCFDVRLNRCLVRPFNMLTTIFDPVEASGAWAQGLLSVILLTLHSGSFPPLSRFSLTCR